jgi:hypothetical protein
MVFLKGFFIMSLLVNSECSVDSADRLGSMFTEVIRSCIEHPRISIFGWLLCFVFVLLLRRIFSDSIRGRFRLGVMQAVVLFPAVSLILNCKDRGIIPDLEGIAIAANSWCTFYVLSMIRNIAVPGLTSSEVRKEDFNFITWYQGMEWTNGFHFQRLRTLRQNYFWMLQTAGVALPVVFLVLLNTDSERVFGPSLTALYRSLVGIAILSSVTLNWLYSFICLGTFGFSSGLSDWYAVLHGKKKATLTED